MKTLSSGCNLVSGNLLRGLRCRGQKAAAESPATPSHGYMEPRISGRLFWLLQKMPGETHGACASPSFPTIGPRIRRCSKAWMPCSCFAPAAQAILPPGPERLKVLGELMDKRRRVWHVPLRRRSRERTMAALNFSSGRAVTSRCIGQ